MNRIDIWFALVVELAVLATLFPLIAWGIAALLKRRSAALRCRVWMLALIALLTFPAVSRMLPRFPSTEIPGTAIRYVPGSLDGFESQNFVLPRIDIPKTSSVTVGNDTAFEFRSTVMLLLETAAVVGWASGAVFLLLTLAVSIRAARKLLRNASEKTVAEPWKAAVENIARKLRIRAPRLAVNESISVPMVVGVLHPTVLLPGEHVDWSPAERDGVLLHELSHLKRRDPLGLVFSRIVVAIYWFHPFVWKVAERQKIERETACDDAVLLHGEEPHGYATFLLKIAAGRPTSWTPALCLAMSETNPVEERIDSVLDAKKPRTPLMRPAYWWTLAGLATIIFVAALFSPVAPVFPIGLFKPISYTATAWIQVLRTKPHYIFEESSAKQRDLEEFINTQFALIRSPIVMEKALENPTVSRMSFVRRQRDRVAWLAKNIKLEAQPKSEWVTVSFSAPEPKDASEIVNSVVNAYFEYYENQNSDWNTRLINQLTLELNRQQNAARLLQEEIRSSQERTAMKGGPTTAESLLREVYLAESKLEAVRAELKAMKEYIVEKWPVPEEVLQNEIEKDPTLIGLVKQQTEAQEKWDALKKNLPEDDPQVTKAKDDVRNAYDKVVAYQKTIATAKKETLLREAKATSAQIIREKEIAVRTQEILVENLRARYKEALSVAGGRAVEIADVSFQEAQLKRINQVLDLLQTRVVTLQTEMTAPAQVQLRKKASIPTEPDRWSWW